jgi:hypothetical protein
MRTYKIDLAKLRDTALGTIYNYSVFNYKTGVIVANGRVVLNDNNDWITTPNDTFNPIDLDGEVQEDIIIKTLNKSNVFFDIGTFEDIENSIKEKAFNQGSVKEFILSTNTREALNV